MFSVRFCPSTPMNELRLTTSGSFRITSASSCWCCAIAANDELCAATEMPWIAPVSCTGKKPFGTMTYSQIVTHSVAKAISSVSG